MYISKKNTGATPVHYKKGIHQNFSEEYAATI
jgi:hypothetical protein